MYSYMHVSSLLKIYINKAMFYCILAAISTWKFVYLYTVLYVMFTVFLLCSRGPLGRMAIDRAKGVYLLKYCIIKKMYTPV